MMPQILAENFRVPVLIFGFFLGFYLFTAKGVIHIADGMVNFQTVRALVEDKGLAVDCAIVDEFVVRNGNGRCYSKYDLGLALTSLPFYLAGRLIAPDPPNMSTVSIPKLFVSTVPQFVTATTCAVLYLLALHLSQQKTAAFGVALLYGMGTLAWPYAALYFSQSLVGLLLLLAATLLMLHPKPYLRVGILLGWACLTRLDTLPLAIVMIGYAGHQLRQHHLNKRQWMVTLFQLVTPMCLTLLVYLGLNFVRTGNVWQSGYANEGWTTPLGTGLYGLLLSPGRGLLFYSPLTVLAAMGLWDLWQRGWQAEVALIVTLVVGQMMLYATWWAWEGGWVWGPRFLLSTQALLMVGLLPWLENRWPRWVVLLTAVPAFVIQFIGMATEPYTYLTESGFTYQQSLFTWQASTIVGQWHDLLARKYSFLLANRAYGLLSTPLLLIWVAICFTLMFGSLWLLREQLDA